MKSFFVLIFFLLISGHLFADEAGISYLLKQVEEKKLYQNAYWKKILHYKNGFFSDVYESDVMSDQFFLSPNGKSNSQEEMSATVQSFFEKSTKDPNNHPQCRFRARYIWLRKVLDWKEIRHKEQPCPKFNEWIQEEGIESISLIFAAGYLGNPASFFGHPLLKFNYKKKLGKKSLMDMSVNYGAFTPKDVDPISYVMKGVFGGYEAGFTHLNFFYSNHNYTETELRNLWEYELKLNREQIDLIAAHLWELLGVKFPYFFFADNCSNRIAELIETVIDVSLMPTYTPWSIPFSLFDRLSDEKLIGEAKLIPSRQSRMIQRYKKLTYQNKKIAKSIIEDIDFIETESFQSRKESDKKIILEALLEYYGFRLVDKNADIKYEQAKKRCLLERLKLSRSEQTKLVFKVEPPHHWQKFGMIQVSYFVNRDLSNGGAIRWRPAYYDLLTPDLGRDAYGELRALDTEVAYNGKRFWLNRFVLFSIKSLNISHTGLSGDGGLSWELRLSYDRQDLTCEKCMNFNLSGGIGKASIADSKSIIYFMIVPRVQTEAHGSGHFALEPQAGLLSTFAKWWRSHILVKRRHYFDGNKSRRISALWENRFIESRRHDIRLSVQYDREIESKLSYSFYY